MRDPRNLGRLYQDNEPRYQPPMRRAEWPMELSARLCRSRTASASRTSGARPQRLAPGGGRSATRPDPKWRAPITGLCRIGALRFLDRAHRLNLADSPLPLARRNRTAAPSNSVHDILIRGGLLFDGSGCAGVPADLAIKDGRIAAIGPQLDEPAAKTIDASGPRRRAGLHRHQDPFRLHAADQSQGREQGPPGRHHRDHRPLRLLGRARPARQGRIAEGLSVAQRAVDAVPRDDVSRISRQLPGDLRERRHAGRPQHAPPDGDGHGGPRADASRARRR